MGYETREDLPDTIRSLPEEAQEIYLTAYRRSWENYNEEAVGGLTREGIAHRDAWAAMRREFIQDETGQWHRRGAGEEDLEELEEDDEDEGFFEQLGDMFSSDEEE